MLLHWNNMLPLYLSEEQSTFYELYNIMNNHLMHRSGPSPPSESGPAAPGQAEHRPCPSSTRSQSRSNLLPADPLTHPHPVSSRATTASSAKLENEPFTIHTGQNLHEKSVTALTTPIVGINSSEAKSWSR